MRHYSVEDFKDKIDSLYRLVIIASRRASQISRGEARSFPTTSRKPTSMALEEILEGKVTWAPGESDVEDYI